MSIKPLIEDVRLRAEKAGATLSMSRARDVIAHLLFGRSYSASIAAERDGWLLNPELTVSRTDRLRTEYGRQVGLIADVATAVLSEKPKNTNSSWSRGPSWTPNLNVVAVHKLMRSAAEVGYEISFSEISEKTFDNKKLLWLFRRKDEWYAEVLLFHTEIDARYFDISNSCFVHYKSAKDGKCLPTSQVCSLQDEHPRCITVGPASKVKSKSEQRRAFVKIITRAGQFRHTEIVDASWTYPDTATAFQHTVSNRLIRHYLPLKAQDQEAQS
ncbi:hypothetical protein VOM14_16305 [Paraburkholderia sp. MPAMCS5]|uniref:hypothetical protein n=1 Tax=Paraburkholderia sp. MPAMCS5 TaxID=3112563 RepID=UPI002E1784FA|nr:hypothetical protein [Paraburkholderia sp. MPAMCS5]